MAEPRKPKNQYADLPIVQSHLRLAAEMVGRKVMVRHLEQTDSMLRHMKIADFDSPLELLFWLWWNALQAANDRIYPYDVIHLDHNVPVEAMGESYRLDFVLVLVEPRWVKALNAGVLVWPKMAVEVDGHAFHERTPEQVAKRDSRDRNLLQAGWQVFHYSWSEFTKEPQRCAEEVFDVATSIAVDLYQKYTEDVPAELRGE